MFRTNRRTKSGNSFIKYMITLLELFVNQTMPKKLIIKSHV